MKAIVIERYGGPEALELKDVAKPTPKRNEVLVRVYAASVNDWDWGLLQGTPVVNRIMVGGLFTPKVRIIGGDIAGRVETLGRDVKAFKPGDEVHGDLCMSGFGAFAEYVCAPETCLVHKPASMTFEQAAEDGSLSPVIDGPYTLADLPEAFRRFGMGDHKGKIIVTMT